MAIFIVKYMITFLFIEKTLGRQPIATIENENFTFRLLINEDELWTSKYNKYVLTSMANKFLTINLILSLLSYYIIYRWCTI